MRIAEAHLHLRFAHLVLWTRVGTSQWQGIIRPTVSGRGSDGVSPLATVKCPGPEQGIKDLVDAVPQPIPSTLSKQQVAAAIGEGATAVLMVRRYLETHRSR